ncbi:DUF2771 domain-containing protein [Hoyosella altamirensis]|uniref:DUF2771 domain-containing protein n=1 Tax=Hoyosella altamirensis TaxID=616997 RepID=A0A839RT25_9ACTN|nr:DUF2771 domain-containing protein [Hoyosella altamirensis]MBB3039368.1 hypothetical protein [Hoyosella altamirensis]
MPVSRKFIAIVAAVAVVSALGVAAVIAAQAHFRGDEPHRPHLTVYSAGNAKEVDAFQYCDLVKLAEVSQRWAEQQPLSPEQEIEATIDFADTCDPEGQPALINIRPDETVQISLPKEIAGAPWSLLALYEDNEAREIDVIDDMHRPSERRSVSLPTFNDDGLALRIVEIKLPMGIVDAATGEQSIVSHATWAIHTQIMS